MSTVPSSITTSFLKNVIKSYDKNVQNFDFSITPLIAGEHFVSALYQISINYESLSETNEETSLILKCPSGDELLSDYAKTMRLFENEIDMYHRILPKIECLEYVNKFWTSALYASKIPQTMLILRDLNKLGYKMQSRHKGLDLNHCMLVMEKLAFLHASSIAISKKESLSNFDVGMFGENRYNTAWITIGLETLIETCTKLNHLNQYAVKLRSMQNNFLEKVNASTKSSTICNVLNHGDCWVNNFMFSYNEDGTTKDMVLVDFQHSIYCSPVIDLHCFWATSPNSNVLRKHFGDFLDCYYNKFVNNAEKLNIVENIPSKHEIETDFKQKAIYGLNTLLTTTLFVKSSKRSDASFENYVTFSGEGTFRHDCHNNERYIESIGLLLPFYDNLGVFD